MLRSAGQKCYDALYVVLLAWMVAGTVWFAWDHREGISRHLTAAIRARHSSETNLFTNILSSNSKTAPAAPGPVPPTLAREQKYEEDDEFIYPVGKKSPSIK